MADAANYEYAPTEHDEFSKLANDTYPLSSKVNLTRAAFKVFIVVKLWMSRVFVVITEYGKT